MLERAVDTVLNKIDIVDVVSSYVQLKKVGANFRALCPFHNERTPSFYVSPSKQIFHCFGCGAGGNAIHFVMRMEKLTFMEALRHLAKLAKIDIDLSLTSSPKERELIKKKEELISVHSDCYDYFREELFNKKNIQAVRYALKRRISKNTIERFGIGFCPEKNDLYESLLKKYSKEILDISGIFTEKNGKNYCRFEGRLIFPIFDTMNRIIAFGARAISDSVLPKYINSSDTMIFSKSKTLYGLNIAKNTKQNHFLIVEGYMDVLMLHQEGIDNAIGVLGTALTADHSYIIKRYKNEVVLCLDSDEAGKKAVLRGADVLYQNGIVVRVMELESAKDPDEFVRRFGKDAFLLRENKSLYVIDYKIKELQKGFDLTKSADKFKFVKQYFQSILDIISNDVEKQEYIKKLSQITDIKQEAIEKEYNAKAKEAQIKAVNNINILDAVNRKNKMSDEELLKKNEVQLIALYAQWAPNSIEVRELLDEDDFYTPEGRELFVSLKKIMDEGIELNYPVILSFVADDKILSELTSFSSKGFDTVDVAKKAIEQLKVTIEKSYLDIELRKAKDVNDTQKIYELIEKLKRFK